MPRLPWRSRVSRWLRNLAETLDPAPAGLDLDGAPAVWADHVRAANARGRVRPVGTRRAPGRPPAPEWSPPTGTGPDRTRQPGWFRFRRPDDANAGAADVPGGALRRVSTPAATSHEGSPRTPPRPERAQTPHEEGRRQAPTPRLRLAGPLVRAVFPQRGAELRPLLPPRSVPTRSEQAEHAEQAEQAKDSLGRRAGSRGVHETRAPAAVVFPDDPATPEAPPATQLRTAVPPRSPARARVSPPPAREPGLLPPILRASPAPAVSPRPVPGNAADARPGPAPARPGPAWGQPNPAHPRTEPAHPRQEPAQAVPEPSPAPPVPTASLWPELPARPEPAAQPLPALEPLLYRLDRLSAEQAAT